MTEEELKRKAATMTRKEASEEDRRIFKPIHEARQKEFERILAESENFERQKRNSSVSSGGDKIKEVEVRTKPRFNMIRLVEEDPDEPEDPKTLEAHEDPITPTEVEESEIQDALKTWK